MEIPKSSKSWFKLISRQPVIYSRFCEKLASTEIPCTVGNNRPRSASTLPDFHSWRMGEGNYGKQETIFFIFCALCDFSTLSVVA